MYVQLGASPAIQTTAATAATAGSVAAAAAPLAAGTSLAPFLAPIPIVGGIIAGALAIGSLLFHGADPRQAADVNGVLYPAEYQTFQIWKQISGEDLGHGWPGPPAQPTSSKFNQSDYPNVPLGPTGDPSIDVNAAIAQVQQILAQSRAQVQLAKSASNPFWTANHVLGLLTKMAAARAATPAGSTGSGAPGISTSTLLLAGGGLAAAYLLL